MQQQQQQLQVQIELRAGSRRPPIYGFEDVIVYREAEGPRQPGPRAAASANHIMIVLRRGDSDSAGARRRAGVLGV